LISLRIFVAMPWVMGLQIFARGSHATHQPITRPTVTLVTYEFTINLHNNLGGWICGLLLFIQVRPPTNQLPNKPANRPAMTQSRFCTPTYTNLVRD